MLSGDAQSKGTLQTPSQVRAHVTAMPPPMCTSLCNQASPLPSICQPCPLDLPRSTQHASTLTCPRSSLHEPAQTVSTPAKDAISGMATHGARADAVQQRRCPAPVDTDPLAALLLCSHTTPANCYAPDTPAWSPMNSAAAEDSDVTPASRPVRARRQPSTEHLRLRQIDPEDRLNPLMLTPSSLAPSPLGNATLTVAIPAPHGHLARL